MGSEIYHGKSFSFPGMGSGLATTQQGLGFVMQKWVVSSPCGRKHGRQMLRFHLNLRCQPPACLPFHHALSWLAPGFPSSLGLHRPSLSYSSGLPANPSHSRARQPPGSLCYLRPRPSLPKSNLHPWDSAWLSFPPLLTLTPDTHIWANSSVQR